ncbi:interferon lambda receptor 1 isoform X2 [Cyanistes caeruleus]|uniref:interferon lambda receptor 1 isoform X2 n=1 Tax=Cyanistes caeruleus TaxID=156563 RepID=UPI000CDA3C43|nr:interferon lambda receptor 1 isoform X2 [Cyanistes caeruleus]
MRMDQGETFKRSGKFCFAVCGWRVGALMALCLLQQARGHVQLLPPQNVTLLSKDFALILTWAPGEGSPPGVTYTVRYESQDRLDRWMKVPHCKNIPRSFCNLTCALSSFFVKVRARVKAVWGRSQSPWVKSQFKDYYSDVELAPPVLTLNVSKNSIHVSASFPLPKCVENLTWKYDLNLWEAGSEDKKKYEGYFRKDTVTINTTALRGNYCFSARALYESISLKYSEFSQPVCVQLNHKVEWKFPLLVMILLLVLIFVFSPFICCLVKHEAKERKMPLVLDFSQFKAAGPTLHLELSEKELCSDDLNCTERPVPQRRTNRALGEHHLPWVASFQSSSSSSSSEGEEEEDSSPLIPYHEMPRYPKRHLSCQPPTAAPGESSLDSGSAGLAVHTGSVLDLRALGFTLSAERKAEVDTSGSQENEEVSLYLCSSLGRISLTDVRFPAASEHGQGDGNGDERMGMTPLHPLPGGIPAEPHEQHPHRKAPHFSRDYQESVLGLQLQMDSTSQPREDPSSQLLIPLWTLQVAEDEGIASDCGSDSFTEEALPDPTLLSEAFETSNTEEKYDPKFQFPGYKHSHYLGRI